jgi:hypothetical protein
MPVSVRKTVDSAPPARASSRPTRKAVIMVFVLTMLVLLALVGLVLIARTHGESRRVTFENNSASERSVLGSVVRGVQETLRRDIWGSNPTFTSTPLNNATVTGHAERNEPFDDPGPADRWLASSVPYMDYQLDSTQPGYGRPRRIPTGHPVGSPLETEKEVLTWPYVSYLGSDITEPAATNYFYWPNNSRMASVTPVRYGESSNPTIDNLANVRILQTPPPRFTLDIGGRPIPLITGSTTNVTIAQARRVWTGDVAATPPTGFVPRFPYFDTNADGVVDLYDADGDGIPDSPLSFAIPLENKDTNTSRRLYAAIRIVDHASMLNVDAAFSLKDGAGSLIFDETGSDLQRRGRRSSELLLDDVVHASDWAFGGNRTGHMVDYRNMGNPSSPQQWDTIIRSKLAGGATTTPFRLYGLNDEASLRHRGLLVPYDRRSDGGVTPQPYDSVDRALEGSMIWTRAVDPSTGNYTGTEGRWCRLNSDISTSSLPNPTFEGFDDPTGVGWRQLMREDEPYGIRRRLMTTMSHEVAIPSGFQLDASGDYILGLPPDTTATARAALFNLPNEAAHASAPSSLMDWPVIRRSAFPNINDNLRVQQIDLNMTNTADPDQAKSDFIRYSAGAMYLALENVTDYQGIRLIDDPSTPEDETLNRIWLSWQFALNLADYRDADTTPTVAEWPAGSKRYLFGVEEQPFFTEAYAYLTAGTGPSSVPLPFQPPDAEDKWFHAVELYVPPYYNMPMTDLYVRTPGGAPGLMPLASFLNVASSAPATLDGGVNGKYIVLCGNTVNGPGLATTSTFFTNRNFRIAEDGTGDVELVYAPGSDINSPFGYVLDVIGPRYSGDGNLSCPGSDPPAVGRWGKRPTTITAGQHWSFDLRRSTKGWRFSHGWQQYGDQPVPAMSQTPDYEDSLGTANAVGSMAGSNGLDEILPESIWPARVGINTSFNAPLDGFTSGQPYSVFDSPGELSRVMMIGPVNRYGATNPSVLQPPYFCPESPSGLKLPENSLRIPATALLAAIVKNHNTGATKEFYAAGRPDFIGENPTDLNPWAWKLLDYFTTQSPLFDGVDNDGDGNVDDAADPLEGVKILNRLVGRININTAPAAVLRSVPYMSLLPTSAEYAAYGVSTNPYQDYQNDVTGPNPLHRFWDIASAIVSKRENRPVPLRLRDTAPGPLQGMRIVAVSERPAGPLPNQPPPGSATGFRSLGELVHLTDQRDTFIGGTPNDALFRTDRFMTTPALALASHKRVGSDPDVGAGVIDVFSPDYRYRKIGTNEFDAGYTSVETDPLAVEIENAGVRARDIFLARFANLLTTRSDVFTAYIALIDEDGRYIQRSQVTLDRSGCFTEIPGANRPVLPKVVLRSDSSYADDLR